MLVLGCLGMLTALAREATAQAPANAEQNHWRFPPISRSSNSGNIHQEPRDLSVNPGAARPFGTVPPAPSPPVDRIDRRNLGPVDSRNAPLRIPRVNNPQAVGAANARLRANPESTTYGPPARSDFRPAESMPPGKPVPPLQAPSQTEDDEESDDEEDDEPTYFPECFSWGEDAEMPLEAHDEILGQALLSPQFVERTQLHFFGWQEQGLTFNPQNPSNRLNGIVAPNDRSNAYQMNELYLVFERRLNRDADRIDFGGRVDLLYGTSAFAYQAAGLDNEIVSDSASRFYQLALPQAYVSAYLPNLPLIKGATLQAGHYYSTLGYEFLAPHNFFYSFANYNLGIPFTNTGGMATLQLTDNIVLQQGFSRGWDIWNAPKNNQLSYTGSLQWFTAETETWLYLAWMVGPELVGRHGRRGFNGIDNPLGGTGPLSDQGNNEKELRAVVSLFLEHSFTDNLEYALISGVGHQNGDVAATLPSFDWAWIANYVYYTINPQLAAGVRAEWFHDGHGLFITPPRQPGSFAPGDLYEVTVGLNWQPKSWIRVRPEIRYDWQRLNDASAMPSFNDGKSTHQILFAADALITF